MPCDCSRVRHNNGMRQAGARYLITCLGLAVSFTILSLWTTKCSDENTLDNNFYRDELKFVDRTILENTRNRKYYDEIKCSINDEFSVPCRREEEDVFIPFSFIKKYFEISGSISRVGDDDIFQWKHSYSKVFRPVGPYSPHGVFLSFAHYAVEVRERVKCLDAINGVPLSTQWGLEGYYYPTQVAQFGLSHYSKYIMSGDSNTSVLVDGDSFDRSVWKQPDSTTLLTVFDGGRQVILFSAPKSVKLNGLQLEIQNGMSTIILSFTVRFRTNASITAVFESHDGKEYYVHYVSGYNVILRRRNRIFYGLGDVTNWRTVTRDVFIDLQKGLAIRGKRQMRNYQFVRNLIKCLARVELHGTGYVDNITLSRTAHLAQFFDAASWLVKHQDDHGGWPISVKKITKGAELSVLQPGWYSAMAQGQAISLLVRAYLRTNKADYLNAAKHATKLFSIPSHKGGVLAKFMQHYDWYEEYPTMPSVFVLNGFMYALFGLYDLMVAAPDYEPAAVLYLNGMKSLEAMLLLYDTGWGSVYDLRHLQLKLAPNVARWDYHTTHINQLLHLGTIDKNPLWNITAERWVGYNNGHRAPHN